MRMHRGIIAVGLALLACLAGQQAIAASPQAPHDISLQDMRLGLTPGRTRLVLDLSAPVTFSLPTQDSTDRLTIDLHGVSAAESLQIPALSGTGIQQISMKALPGQTLRISFEIAADTRTEFFDLAPFEGQGHRLVIDLYETEVEQPMVVTETKTPPTRSTAPISTISVDAAKRAAAMKTSTGEQVHSEWTGYLSLDSRLFFSEPAFPGQGEHSVSIAAQPEYYRSWASDTQRLVFSPFLRYDSNDQRRTHADLSQLYWQYTGDRLALKLGADIVFWGVTESQHLVDIINQTDLVENIDGEEKLGQPMINLDYHSDWGIWQGYVMPYFRERTFPGEDGRLRTALVVDEDQPVYESSGEEYHTDFALRWSHYIGSLDVGISHFSGTSREPLLIAPDTGPADRLLPLYLQIDQTSIDLQSTRENWLWKLEALYNQNSLDDYYAWVGGFEYTLFGVSDTTADLGLLLEYNYDDRGDNATSGLQDDLYAGFRLTANDLATSSLLFGVIVDRDTHAIIGNLEASRRLGETWVLTLESRFFNNIKRQDMLYSIKKDSYLEIRFARFF